MEIVGIKAVAVGGVYCDCGGLMIQDNDSGLLMCDPPKVKIYCPFCGESDYVYSPYKVDIQFKRDKL